MSFNVNTTFQSRLVSQVNNALGDNTSAQATGIKNDANKLLTDTTNGASEEEIQEDTSQLVTDTNAAVSSGLISSTQARYIETPAALVMEGTDTVAGGSDAASGLAALFQKYCENNNIPCSGSSFQTAWQQFTQTLQSSFPQLSDSQYSGSLQSAEQQAAALVGGTPSSSQTPGTSPTSPSTATGSNPALSVAQAYEQDVVNPNGQASAFPAALEQGYQQYCQQNNLDPTQYASYQTFNSAVQQQFASVSANDPDASAEMSELQQYNDPTVFQQVLAASSSGTSPSTSVSPSSSGGTQATTGVGGATPANFQEAAGLADQAYVDYQAAKNDPNASPADKQQLADAAFGKMQRAYEIASDAGMTYAQFQQGLDSAMPGAYQAAQQQNGTTLPGTNYTLNLGSVTQQSAQQGLDTWLASQSDLDVGTTTSVENQGSETANQGANFGTANFQGWLQDASAYDGGQDPFANPNLPNSNG